MRTSRLLMALAVALLSPRLAPAQSSPFLPDPIYQSLVNEISGDIAYEHIRWFTHYHRPMGGSEGYQAVEKYVFDKAREYGLEDVRIVKLKQSGPSWTGRAGELWLVEPDARRLAFLKEAPLALADYSRDADVPSATLVDVGDGTSESDYAGKNVSGAVVLATGSLQKVTDEAVWKRGALGIVTYTTSRMPDYPDQYPWMRVPVENTDKTKQGTWAFVLQPREGERLRAELKASKVPFKVRASVKSEFHKESYQSIVEAVIRGTEIHDQDIVLTGHLQEEMHSANDDASGCANVLEIARALKKMIDEGTLPRPRRDIRFWWLDEISASEQYFADNPAEAKQLLVDINQDMVGAKQSAGSRVQFVTRPPFSRTSYLGDVMESIIESLVAGNTAYLSAGQAAQLRQGPNAPPATTTSDAPFSRPVLSRLGTHERYDARMVPFHNNTDHQVFNMGIIGVPAVTFTNWPDPYIHSSDDDLWQIDATQLKRNAVAVAGAALYLANAGDAQIVTMSTDMYGRALERMSRDARTAMTMTDYRRAANLVRQAARRERRTLESLARFASPGGAADRALKAVLQQLPTEDNAEMRLAAYVTSTTGTKPASFTASVTAREKELAGMVPTMAVSIQQFLDKRSELKKPASLHSLMAYEVLNFVDGTNTYLDIYRAVSAEADAAGDWYYGTVSPEDVASYLDSAKAAGIITVGAPKATAKGTR
ncbi:MAG: M28 family peptidase [Acidobacteriota bacterium]